MTSQHITILPGQPAEVRQHVDLGRLGAEASDYFVQGQQSEQASVQNYALAGERLLTAKQHVGHGNWLSWVAKNTPMTGRQAQRCMKLAQCDKNADLVEQWRIINGNVGEPEPTPSPAVAPKETKPAKATSTTHLGKSAAAAGSPYPPEKRCRECRVHGRDVAGCEDCRLKNLPAEREPGDDTQQIHEDTLEENPWLKPIDAHTRPLLKIADEVARLDVPAARAQQVKTHLAEATKELRELAEAPVKAGDPKPGKCGRCGRQIQWVVSRRGKKLPLDAQPSPRGRFEIVKGVALYVKKEDRKNTVRYQPHQQSCH